MFTGAGVGNIEHIAQTEPVAGIIHQGDALGTAPDVAAHTVVPQVVLGAGSGIRALGVDHQLLMERVLVEATFSAICAYCSALVGMVVCPPFYFG